MPLTLTPTQAARIARALRRGAIDSIRISDAIDPAGRTHFLIEVSEMGKFAKDWDSLKQIIKQKDDALDKAATQLGAQAQQIAALQQQVAGLQGSFDADDQKAAAELHQTIVQNPQPVAGNVTTFTK
jgi:hypothetical protein